LVAPQIIPLVEVVRGQNDEDTVDTTVELIRRVGKLYRDAGVVPGFAINH
jgi:3-hydroxyacyl-CoA dehydrogenase